MYAFILKTHSKFVERAIASSKLLSHALSATPTVIFLLSSFILIYLHLHRTSGPHTKWKARFMRDLKFHWIYFNITRLWFIFLACMKRLNGLAEDFIEANMTEKEKNFNRLVTHGASLVILTSLAFIPVVLFCATYFSKSDSPNFLLWVMEDPYTRHEIGISGHCLERPVRVPSSQKLKNYSYRSKRSTSFDARPWVTYGKPTILCRTCKSMIESTVTQPNDGANNKLKLQ